MMKEENISDSEIRVIGGNNQQPKPTFPWRVVAIVAIVAAVIALLVWLLWPKAPEQLPEQGIFEPETILTTPDNAAQSHPLQTWFASLDSVTATGTITKDTTVNDIPLRIYVPLNSTPRLEIGYGALDNRQQNILFFQAADVRADNKKIVGAFVLRGQPLSWGLSKRGYCAIIDGKVTVGVADNSPLFEQATEHGGYFFRQYPLVDNGKLVENELKNKSIRRGLCEIDGHIAVVATQSTESLHDFAQALVDIGVSNAIYLVGSSAQGWSMDAEGNGTKMGLWDERPYRNISFIVWPLTSDI